VTERLYYRDPALLEFDATLLEQKDSSGRVAVRLDRSAFYPTSGGQSFDLGMINDVPVVEILESDDGEVWHILDMTPGSPGTQVHGSVDPARRLKNRQQHTAQHILSALFVRECNLETVSVHLGDDYGAIELNATAIEVDRLHQLEMAANQIIFDSVPVEIMFAEGEELGRIPLRKSPDRTGQIRIIRIGDLDWSACGGTHCNSTAQVGLVKIIGTEKLRNHVLVKFLSGMQAVQDYAFRFKITDTMSRTLTCAVSDLPGIFESQSNDNKALRKEVSGLQKELLPIHANRLVQTAETFGRFKVVAFESNADAQIAGQLTALVADAIEGISLAVADGRLLLAVSANIQLHAGDLAKQLGTQLGLRGGGSNRQAQLGGADPKKLSEYKQQLMALIPNA
jgi:alanyl-tRNA synthetase